MIKLEIVIMLCLLSSQVQGASLQSTMSASVIETTSISTNVDGFIDVSGPLPEYCELQDNTYMCYY